MTRTDRQLLQELIDRHGREKTALVAILLGIQHERGYLPEELLALIPEMTNISPASVTGVISFYSYFRLKPAGKHRIMVCIGTACYVKGAEQTYQAFRDFLHIPDGEDTDEKRLFTLSKVACLGCCMLAPAVQIDNLVFGWVEPTEVGRVIDEFLAGASHRGETMSARPVDDAKGEVRICLCSSCCASGAEAVYDQLLHWSERCGFPLKATQTGCTGLSFASPFIRVTDRAGQITFYGRINSDNLHSILLRHFRPTSLDAGLDQLLHMSADPPCTHRIDPVGNECREWLTGEEKIVMAGGNEFSPCDLQAYRQNGGFSGLAQAEAMSPQQIVAQILDSGLRGRGGAGFPAGLKWQSAAAATGQRKFVICNADEGDPGAFMDRMLLESVPFRIIEGMLIAARAINAQQGYIFVRREYPLAVARMLEALSLCRDAGILGSGFAIEIVEGAGAFVCGEETALIAAIEGERGIPRPRPPFPAESGLFAEPTLINNVETLANVPWIITRGAEAFKKLGTAGSPGTKTFALAGKIKRGGLIEVPMGISIRRIIEEIGGGVSGNGSLKAVQIGGPSGGCLPESLFDLPIDFEALVESGAIMGSGGLVVLDEHDCMVDIARYFLEFTAGESCGNCSFCRIGSQRMLEILNRLCNRQARSEDLEKLEELAALVMGGSRCGLGRTAPNPVLTTLRYFREEYLAHLQGYCPAGKCQKMFSFKIGDRCNGCMICSRNCPVAAIPFTPWQQAEIEDARCVRCGVCRQSCPEHAVEVVEKLK